MKSTSTSCISDLILFLIHSKDEVPSEDAREEARGEGQGTDTGHIIYV
jgi:hypothetical protein